MAKTDDYFSLKKILDRHNYVLFDTSALIRYLTNEDYSPCYEKLNDNGKTQMKLFRAKEQIDLLNSLIGYVDSSEYKNNFFLTLGVYNELLLDESTFSFGANKSSFRTARKVRNGGMHILSESKKLKQNPFFRTMQKVKKKRERLLELLELKNGILDLASTERDRFRGFVYNYGALRQESFSGRGHHHLMLNKKLSEVDFDLIGNIWILSGEKKKIALVSNDFPIMYSLDRILKNDLQRRINTSLFLRKGQDKYDIFEYTPSQ
jgi:hypothetical protein